MISDAEEVAHSRAPRETAAVLVAESEPVVAAARRRRRRTAAVRATGALVVAGLVGIGLAAAGVVTGPRTAESPAPVAEETAPDPLGPAEEEPGSDPLELVGLWSVDAAGVAPGTLLWLGGGEGKPRLYLTRPCGSLSGSWFAGGSVFAGLISGWPASCVDRGTGTAERGAALAWLESAVAYAPAGDGWALHNAYGDTTATLTPASVVPGTESSGGPWGVPPDVTDDLRAAMSPGPLPDGLVPITAEALAGPWVPAEGSYRTAPRVVFRWGEGWSATDGCHQGGGRWAVDHGRLLTISGTGSTFMGCDGVGVPDWVHGATGAGFDGEVLVLLDREGGELGRLVRDTGRPPGCPDPLPDHMDAVEREAYAGTCPLPDYFSRFHHVGAGFQGGGLIDRYVSSDMFVYWHGELTPEAQALVDEAAADGIHIEVELVSSSEDQMGAVTMAVTRALEAEGIRPASVGFHFDRIAISVTDPEDRDRAYGLAVDVTDGIPVTVTVADPDRPGPVSFGRP